MAKWTCKFIVIDIADCFYKLQMVLLLLQLGSISKLV